MIAISGLDGAGKSTQIKNIENFYTQNNKRVYVFWSRGGYTPGIMFIKSLFLKKRNETSSKVENKIINNRTLAFNNPLLRKLWLVFALCDLIFYYVIVLRYKSIFSNVICDRYILDTQLDFELNFKDENINNWVLWKFLSFFALKPKYYFILTIPVIESQKRSKLKNDQFIDSEEVLIFRLEKYIEYSNLNKSVYHIDGLKSVDNVKSEILEILEK